MRINSCTVGSYIELFNQINFTFSSMIDVMMPQKRCLARDLHTRQAYSIA